MSDIGKCLLLMATQTQNLLSSWKKGGCGQLCTYCLDGSWRIEVILFSLLVWPEHSAQYEASRGVRWNNRSAESNRIAKPTLHFFRLTLLCSCYVEITTHFIWAVPMCQAWCWGASPGLYHLILDTLVWILKQQLTSLVTVSKFLHFSGPQFFMCKMRVIIKPGLWNCYEGSVRIWVEVLTMMLTT